MNWCKCPTKVDSFRFQTDFSEMTPGKNIWCGCTNEIRSPKFFSPFHCIPFSHLLCGVKKKEHEVKYAIHSVICSEKPFSFFKQVQKNGMFE